MITKEQALTLREFHFRISNPHHSHHGEWRHCRRSGQTKTWKRNPERFQVPVKYGMYESFYITDENAAEFFASPEESN